MVELLCVFYNISPHPTQVNCNFCQLTESCIAESFLWGFFCLFIWGFYAEDKREKIIDWSKQVFQIKQSYEKKKITVFEVLLLPWKIIS